MRITEHPGRLVLRDAPGCFWLFGLFFVVVGGVALMAVLNSAAGEVRPPAWQALLGLGMGAAAVTTGVVYILRSPGSQVEMDARAHTLTITRRSPLRRRVERYGWDDIAGVERVETPDTDGDPVYSLALHLKNGQTVRVTHLWLHDPDGLQRSADAMRRFLGGMNGMG